MEKSIIFTFQDILIYLLLSKPKSFLHHCYPDGKGPDAELIQMLERDVVWILFYWLKMIEKLDTNPNVKFEDIADLDQAKNILQEAVLLPIMMPEYFKVI